MIRSWLRAHRSLAITTLVGIVVASVVATTAVTSGGYASQRTDLQDPSVWVAATGLGHVGRVNTQIAALDTVVPVDGADTEIVQSGRAVVAVDRADARADIIDPVTATVASTVPLPPEQPDVFLSGTLAAVYSRGTGQLWVQDFSALADFDAGQRETLALGAGTVVDATSSGTLVAVTPSTGQLRIVDLASGAVRSTHQVALAAADDVSATLVAGHWAVLDATAGTLDIDGRTVDVSGLASDGSLVLQRASDVGSSVLLASSSGLVSAPFDGSAPQALVTDAAGTPAAPVQVATCAYAAWSDGTAWRDCGDGGVESRLAGIQGGSPLVFQRNGSRVLLNDVTGGSAWAVQSDAALIDNWSDLISAQQTPDTSGQTDGSSETVVDPDQAPPIAADDVFGARPGRTTLLPVLLNDVDPNGDVLMIDSTTVVTGATLELIDARQRLQITLPDSATGSFAFDYTVSDGRGGTAEASVRVDVRTDAQNSPPRQVRATTRQVGAGQSTRVSALADWVDPDGDPFYLSSATIEGPDAVTYTPTGSVRITADPSSSGVVTVGLVASDGQAVGTGTISATVLPTDQLPLVADAFAIVATAGQTVTVSPLDHVHGRTAEIQLNAVPPRAGATITPNYVAGTFEFSSDDVRTHYLTYVVTDDDSTATGTVRIDVLPATDSNTAPVTVPQTAFVRSLASATVDVASRDLDPAGGVLLVTAVGDVPEHVVAEIIDQRSVRVTLTGPIDPGARFSYTVTNGLRDATGTVDVVELPPPTIAQPPVARDDTATARVGDTVDIDVLANDEQPDGLDVTLDPQLIQPLTGGSGFLFVAGNRLRYLAPDHPGNFVGVYQITGPGGQVAQAQVSIQVREANVDTDRPPVPATVTARVLAGQTVRVTIPLAGIDPDGDSVQLIGQATSPTKGAVVASGTDWFDYTAGAYSAGTDSFSYTLTDALGARATGTVRIGIAANVTGARDPVATKDDVTVRPGRDVTVRVLANDSDPDGGALEVVSVEPTSSDVTATIADGQAVTVTPPAAPGDYGVLYTIQNPAGGVSSAFITVHVSADAPLAYPVVADSVLTLADIAGRTSVDVDVLRNVFFAEGPASSLGVSVLSGYGTDAIVTGTKHIIVPVRQTAQIIPFAVIHPDDPGVRSFALIRVPGSAQSVPQLDATAPALVVASGQPITIDLDDRVLTASAAGVRITDPSTVQATHANGDPLVVNAHTIRFTSADHYSGPASIAFEVQDAGVDDASEAGSAVLVLPITVVASVDQPPVFTGGVVDFEPGQQKQFDLARLTEIPAGETARNITYRVVQPFPQDFSYRLSGSTLVLSADDGAAVGTTTAIVITASDASGTSQPGRIILSIVGSTRPLVQAAPDAVTAPRGTTTSIDVLENDEPTNPFPQQALRLVSIGGTSTLPAGVSLDPDLSTGRVRVTVGADAVAVDTTVPYVVEDATGESARYGYGSLRISVQDVPATPAAPTRVVDTFVNGELKLRISAPAQNNAPITDYRIVSSSHGAFEQDCGLALLCSITGLEIGQEYRFSVIAVNAIGESKRSPVSDAYTVDFRPAAPDTVTAVPTGQADAPNGRSLTITWPTVPDPDPGTPVAGYTVVITGPGVSYSATAMSPFTTTAGGALVNDAQYSVAVYARNRAQVTSDADWRRTSTTVRTVGPPSAPASGPTASLAADGSGSIVVSWGASTSNGGSAVKYSIGRLDGTDDAPACSTADKPALLAGGSNVTSPFTDESAVDGAVYTYVVYSDNGVFCASSVTGALESKRTPGQASATVTATYRSAGQYDLRVSGLAASGISSRYEYSTGGAWQPVSNGDWLTSIADGSVYGAPVTVTVRACRDSSADYCGAASEPLTATPVNVRASVTSCMPGTPPMWSDPANPAGAVSVARVYSYGTTGLLLTQWSDYTYTDADPVPSDAVGVRVKATVTVGGVDYVDEDYGEATCGP